MRDNGNLALLLVASLAPLVSRGFQHLKFSFLETWAFPWFTMNSIFCWPYWFLKKLFDKVKEKKQPRMSFQISGQFDASGCGQSKGCLYYPTGCMPNQNCQIQFSFLVCQFGIIFESWRRLVSFEKDWSLKFKHEIWSTFSTCFCCCNDQLYFAIPKNLLFNFMNILIWARRWLPEHGDLESSSEWRRRQSIRGHRLQWGRVHGKLRLF